jgi:AraC-like DNA-binding protein
LYQRLIALLLEPNAARDDFLLLDELAARFFITKPYLCRLLKKETGLSDVTYVNAQRL